MSVNRRDRRLADLLGINQLHVFVPAIMSVGVVFWLSSEVRDLIHSSGERSRDKRAAIAGVALASNLDDRGEPDGPQQRGLRPRPLQNQPRGHVRQQKQERDDRRQLGRILVSERKHSKGL